MKGKGALIGGLPFDLQTKLKQMYQQKLDCPCYDALKFSFFPL